MGTVVLTHSVSIDLNNRLYRYMKSNDIINKSNFVQKAITYYLDHLDDENIDLIYSKLSDKGKRKMLREIDKIKEKLKKESL